MTPNNDERVIALLEELVAWTRFSARSGLMETLRQVLSDPRHLRAYELTDGTRTQKEVGADSGMSQPAVSAIWQRWKRLGIVRDRGGRAAHLIRPSDLGLEPSPKSTGKDVHRTEREEAAPDASGGE